MVQFHMFSFLLFSCLLQLLSTVDGSKHNGKCPPSFSCGNLGSISFPFTTTERPDCGILVIHACDDNDPEAVKSIKNRGRWFSVTQVNQLPPAIVIKDDDFNSLLLSRSCDAFSYNISLNASSFASFQIKYSVPIFRCDSSAKINPPSHFSKYTILCSANSNYSYDIYFSTLKTQESLSSKFPGACSLCPLPTKDNQDLDDPFKLISAEIPLEVQVSPNCSSCYNLTGGQCQLDNMGKIFCASVKVRKIVHIVAPVASAAVILLLMALACCFRRKISLFLWKKKNPSHQIIETFLERCGHLPAKRYSYLEVKKVTNSFKSKLGQGGYGSVYKGKLPNGTLVAVKVLSELKGNGEEFINEVASISMTSHVNIVSLLGFCLEGSKRALIYEFMSNGSLEKFIYEEKDPLKLHLQLRSKTMYNIAIGVARGLEYLHRGCNTKILHFDIKPHNILLDDDFFPKISDFGLAKICPQKESHISLFGARGTAGYIAPEVFSRNFGAVSHKSDVYSYGMMVLEMVGGRKNINVEVDRSSELYFPHWIHNHLALNQELELKCIKNESDKEMVKKMITVSLWCIQANPSNRPAVSKVVEMLEGSLESLQVPPKPVLSSPSTSPRHQTQTYQTSSS